MLHPLKRVGPKGAGRFERVSWDEALDDIAARLQAIAARDPQAILPYSYAGTMGLVQGESMAARFFHRLGASLLDRTICSSAGGEALAATYGGKVGMHVEHFAESRLILIWGSNSIASQPAFLDLRAGRPSAPAPSWSASTRAAPRRPTSATSTSRCCPAPTARWRSGLMHELIVNDWLDHDYIDAPHARAGRRCASARCSGRPSARPQVCGITRRRGARRWRATTAPRSRPRSASTTACSACAAAAMRCG